MSPLAPRRAPKQWSGKGAERVPQPAEVREHIQDADELFRLLVESVEDYAIFLLDPAGRVITWNHGAERIKGYAAEEIVGRHFSVFYTPEERAAGKPERLLGAAAAEGRVEDEGWRVRKDGTRVWANVVITALRGDDGGLRAFAKVTRDLTARREAEQALARRSEELARSNADLEQFAYVASHDLQEPLRAVVSYLQLLARRYEGQLDERAAKYIRHATDGAHRVQTLIQDLLTYSRVGRRGADFGPTDVGAAFEKALSNLGMAVAASGAQVTADPLPRMVADGSQLIQLFQNLLSNAIKFRGADPPRVHVSAARDEGGWHFVVRDNGIGIDAEFRERIFVIFQRLHTRDEYPGTGIGLAVCKRIVERHGGDIWAEAAPGGGTAFHFRLPDHPTGDEGGTHP